MDTQKLYNFWKKHIDSKFLFRTVSEEYIPQIKTAGFEHHKDPFEEIKPLLLELFEIVMGLKSKGFIMMRWWGKPVDQEVVIDCTIEDLNNSYIDFTPDYGNIIDYYLNLKGGALVQTVLIFTTELLMKKPELKDDEMDLVKSLNDWAHKKSDYENKVIWIRASSKYFEKAKFQKLDGTNYLASPLGGFENFRSVIEKKGIDVYLPFLMNEKMFHLRTKQAIPNSEIFKITGG